MNKQKEIERLKALTYTDIYYEMQTLKNTITELNQALQLLQGDVSGSFLFEQDNLKTKDLVKISKLREDILMLIHTTDLSEKIIEFLLYPFEEILKHNGVNISVA